MKKIKRIKDLGKVLIVTGIVLFIAGLFTELNNIGFIIFISGMIILNIANIERLNDELNEESEDEIKYYYYLDDFGGRVKTSIDYPPQRGTYVWINGMLFTVEDISIDHNRNDKVEIEIQLNLSEKQPVEFFEKYSLDDFQIMPKEEL